MVIPQAKLMSLSFRTYRARPRWITRILLAVLPLSAIGRESHAIVLVDQLPDPRILAGSSSPLDFYGQTPGRITADDFLIDSPALASHVTWWGQHARPSSGIDDYLVAFYADAAGLPGAKLAEFDVVFASSAHASIPNLMEYQADLSGGFAIAAGTRYWMSMYNANPAAAWRWNNSVYGSDVSTQSNAPPGNEWFAIPGNGSDLAFKLIAIPEPSTVAIALAAIASSLNRRRRLADGERSQPSPCGEPARGQSK
jgi:hypothetical protein